MIRVMSSQPLPPPSLMATYHQTAIETAMMAGALLQEQGRAGFRIEHKDAVNLVTDADRRSEKAIVEALQKTFPNHQILAEEQGLRSPSQSAYRWIIDPLDGTTNFAHGFPVYCVSIALEYHGQCILGVVFDPSRQELFVAERGGGAFLNEQSIQVSQATTLNSALLVTGFGYDIRDTPDNNLDHFCHFSLKAQGVRRTGAAALDLCYVASARFDGFWELSLQPWDTAAGAVILEEAGGRVTDIQGGTFSIYGQGIVASNGLVHDEMLLVLTRR